MSMAWRTNSRTHRIFPIGEERWRRIVEDSAYGYPPSGYKLRTIVETKDEAIDTALSYAILGYAWFRPELSVDRNLTGRWEVWARREV